LNGLISIARKEMFHIIRDKRLVGFIFMMPMMFLFLFGTAITGEIYNISWCIWDLDRSETSREIREKIARTTEFKDPIEFSSYREIEKSFNSGDTMLAVIIPPDFSKKLKNGETADIQILINGSDPTAAIPVMNYVQLILADYQYKIISKRGIDAGVEIRDRYYFNPDLRGYPFYIAGLIGLLMTQVGLVLAAMSIVGEKERGTMELMLTSPVPSWQIVVGKLLPYLIISFWDILLVLFAAYLMFGIVPAGSIWLLMFLSIFFVTGNLGVGLLISTVADSQQQATYFVMFVMLLSMILSGYLFPIVSMPLWIQNVTYLIPLRYFITILRGIIIKGVGFSAFINEFVALITYSLLMVTIASIRFKKTIG
jgi:ABC-2 type transport system permease protein